MAATQAESQRSEPSVDQTPTDQHSESRNALLQNGTDKTVGRVPPDGVVNTKSKSPMSADSGPPRDGPDTPGHDRSGDRPPPDQYGQYRYPEGGDPYYGQRPGFPVKARPPPPQQRFFPGQAVSQAPGPTPTLNSLLQSSGAPPHRYPNSYEQPPGGYGPAPGWPPRPMPPSPYNQNSPYRNSTAPRPGGPGYGGPPYGGGAPGGPQPPGAYGPPGSYPQRYPPCPPGAPNNRPPFSPHQGYERGGSPQPPPGAPSPGPGQGAPGPLSPSSHEGPHPSHPGQHPGHPPHGQPPPHQPPPGAPSPGPGQGAPGPLSPSSHEGPHPSHPGQHPGHPPHGQPPPHQGYPPRPPQPSTPNAHDPDSDLTGQNSNDSGGSGGAGRATTPHLRPTPSPTGSSGSRSMSPAVGTQNVPMPPRPSSSQSDGSGPTSRPPGAPAPNAAPPAMVAQPPYHGYKPPHYPPQPYAYPPRNHHPYQYGGYRPPPPHPPQHYPPLKQQPPTRHMGPPSAHDGPMPPPPGPGEHDNGPAPPATALVTTGPDGAPLDEGSQQSTLSNASAASGEEACGTPKASRKEGFGVGSAAPSPSPGAGSHSSAHDDYDASPSSWPRPPSSPVFNSHIPPESYRSKKSDSLGKLYEMDDAPERRGWVERLLAFMEDRRTPIAACPTISKQPLDLYRLYLLVRERGGFVEVTKNKTWKDIAGLLGIGASSSAAYTLRKHYTKNLLAYECHFDRGGIDPQPIINQVEASTKKKGGKSNANTNAGSSNSQEAFPVGGNPPAAPMDGYSGQYPGYPPQANQSQGAGPAADNLAASNPFDEPPRRPPGYQQGYGGYEYGAPYQGNRTTVYPPYGPEGDRGYPPNEQYRYGPGGGYGGAYRPGGVGAVGGVGAGGAVGAAGAVPASTPPPGAPYSDYYRAPPTHPHPQQIQHPQHPPQQHPQHPPQQPPPHEMSAGGNLLNSQLARQLVAPLPAASKNYYGGGKGMGPPNAGGQPRRHPDFAGKDGYLGPGPGGPGGPGPAGGPAGPAGGARPPFPQQWSQFPRAPPAQPPATQPWRPPPGSPAPHPSHPAHPAWPQYQQPPPGQPGSGWGPGPGAPRPAGPEPYPPVSAASPGAVSTISSIGLKREMTFPPESVEATVPSAEKRRRLTRADVGPVDAWRIMMALKSGLLAETTWALDILNILLFDDNCIAYFGLQHMPGLLDLLLEHFQKSLTDIFDTDPPDDDEPWYAPPPKAEPPPKEERKKIVIDPDDRVKLLSGENYTLQSRRRRPVTYKNEELFAPEDGCDSDTERFDDAVMEPWQFGCEGTFVSHVMPSFQSEKIHLPIVRVMDSKRPFAPSPRVHTPNGDYRPPVAETDSEVTAERTDSVRIEPERLKVEPDADCDNLESEPMELERDADAEPAHRPLQIRDPAGVLRRRRLSDYEDECYTRDEPSLNLVDEAHDALAKRCVALSNILRGLTFVPGNEVEFSRSSSFLALAGRLLLLHHEHSPRAARAKVYERASRDDVGLDGHGDWWWDTLARLREDALVACANVAGGVELSSQPEAVARPLLDGLLHWSVCPAAVAADAPPSAPPSSPLSPRRLALEALCKLCVTDANVDLVLATPPRARIASLCASLARDLCRPERPVVREFAVNLLHYLAGAGSGAAREVALHAPAVSQLVAFIERAEQTALNVATQHGVSALRDNPDAMGTSLDMLRRAAATLLRLAEHPRNRPLLRRHERRLLSLVMSQILDQRVAHDLADVLYQCGRGCETADEQDDY